MKSIITLTAVTILAALAATGCNQNTAGNSTDASATNSNMTGGSGISGTNMPSTNSLPDMNTNMPAKTNQ
jgi:hypothetical protein